MKKWYRLLMAILVIALIFSSCQEDEIENKQLQDQEITQLNREEIATNLVDLFQDEVILNDMVSFFEANKFGASLETIINNTNPTEKAVSAKKSLQRIIQQSNKLNERAEETGIVQIPELWMFQPEKEYQPSDVLVAFVPKEDEKDWTKIKSFNLKGEEVYLDPEVEPERPVIIVELNGLESLKLRVDHMNEELQSYGLQEKMSENKIRLKSGLETTKIEKIRLNDDKEPWIKGAAEIYAITSGVRGDSNSKEAEIAIVAMPYLDYKDENYYPNQIILFWDDYSYQAANIQLYEQDSNYNYKELVGIIVDGVFEITGILTAEPWVSALGKIASAIIQAMPDNWYSDDDDYVDSYYTVMKDQSYTNYYGAANNAKITMKPFFISEN